MRREVDTHVLGCKVNFADARRVLGELPDSPDSPLALVGTCCVTAEGEKQSRKQVRRAARRVGSTGTVLVTGCASRYDPQAFRSIADNVVVLEGEADAACRRAGELFSHAATRRRNDDSREISRQVSHVADRKRYFIKVQDGCANNCSYCVIPLVRGKPRSIPAARVLEEAQTAAAAGYPELVVSGINVGIYRDEGAGLAELLARLSRVAGVARLRLSSIEANHLSPDLLKTLAGLENFARHLHVPLQSGDDRILADMGRRYDSDGFAARLEEAHRHLPGVNITTDAIVGYPEEDDNAFGNTMRLVKAIGATKIHVFSFSPRPGTRAARKGSKPPVEAVKQRSSELRQLSERLGEAHRRRKLDRVSEVLLESARDARIMTGFSGDYTRFVVAPGDGSYRCPEAGTIVRVIGTGVNGAAVEGKVLE